MAWPHNLYGPTATFAIQESNFCSAEAGFASFSQEIFVHRAVPNHTQGWAFLAEASLNLRAVLSYAIHGALHVVWPLVCSIISYIFLRLISQLKPQATMDSSLLSVLFQKLSKASPGPLQGQG